MAAGILVGIGALVFALDVILKQYVEENLTAGCEREVTASGGRVVLRKVYNQGAMLNLLENHAELLKLISVGIGGASLLYDTVLLQKRRRMLEKTGMMLFTGGALSNIFDRLVRGKVIDYLGFRSRWKKLSSITWNLGDFAIVAGALIVTVSRLPRRAHTFAAQTKKK